MDATTRALIDIALAEDIGTGDVTSALIPEHDSGNAVLVAKETIVLSGRTVFTEVFLRLDPSVRVQFTAADGELLQPGQEVAEVSGSTRSLLKGERTALNFIQRLSGIATLARTASQAVAHTQAQVLDTRKTTPGFRTLEKAAVRHGGAQNHRFGLFDGVLIKDNHIDAVGGVAAAIEAARKTSPHLLKIECEVRTLDEFEIALSAGADVILLDNMDEATMREAADRRRQHAAGLHVRLEASGNVTLERLNSIAQTGVDFISMGALTHSARAVDFSLKYRT